MIGFLEKDAKSSLSDGRKNLIWPHMETFRNYEEKALIIVKADGCTYSDINGREYLDGISGVANVNAGYGRKEIANAVKNQVDILPFNFSSYSASIPSLELAEKLINILPGNMSRIFFGTGGAEANETAFKLARQYQCLRGEKGRYRIISRRISYHGGTIGAMSATGFVARRHPFEPLLLNFPKTDAAYTYRCSYNHNHSDCGLEYARDLERVIKLEGADSISAFIAEPIVGFAGAAIVPPPEYFPLVREICDKYDILLISDEIITGFARTGKMFASEHWNLKPDILTMGKGITSGYSPLSAVAVCDKVVDEFSESESVFMHGITYGAHPVSCAAGISAVDIYRKENLAERSVRQGEYLRRHLKDLDNGIIGDVRGLGLLTGIEFVKNTETKEPFKMDEQVGKLVTSKAMDKGVKLFGGKGGEPEFMGDLLIVCPPLTVTEEQLDTIVGVIDDSIKDVKSSFI